MINKPDALKMASVIIPTYDRPQDLALCLQVVIRQQARIPLEFIVVDNHPESDVTPSVVAQFPGVKLVTQPLKGLSYARNAGVHASQGDVLLFIDDDILVTEHWAETMLATFSRDDIMAVTGRVLPYSTQTQAEHLFETYISFDRGPESQEYGTQWFKSFWKRSVPTHYIGGGGNSAIRRSAFSNPRIGLFNERLGAGTPIGSAEDQYCFYKILKAGYSIVYQASAEVLHKHRTNEEALYKQLLAYGKAVVGYELECLVDEHDWRALLELAVVLPVWHLRNFFQILVHFAIKREVPEHARMDMTSLHGNLLGFNAWYRSRKRLKRMGASPALRPINFPAGALTNVASDSIASHRA